MPEVTSPFELPELRRSINKYLRRIDLACCILVCKKWHTFFFPSLWHGFEDSDYNRKMLPPLAQIIKYGHLIKKFSSSKKRQAYLVLFSPNLTYMNLNSTKDLGPHTLALKQQLSTLDLYDVKFADECSFWRTAEVGLPQLKSLSVCKLDFSILSIGCFWNICPRLEKLKISLTHLPQGPPSSLLFTPLRKLEITVVNGISLQDIDNWIARCPNLQTLAYSSHAGSLPLRMLSSLTVTELWPRLERLELSYCNISDRALAAVLSGMRQIKELWTMRSDFGPLSYAALRPHFSHLEKLLLPSPDTYEEAKEHRVVTWEMTHEILISCPKLVTLHGAYAPVNDVLKCQSTPWACSGTLQSFGIEFEFPIKCNPSTHRFIFALLSQLKRLVTLFLHVPSNSPYPSLDIRVISGLDKLEPLKCMMHIYLTERVNQTMEMEDLQWMIDHWPKFIDVMGPMNSDQAKNGALLNKKYENMRTFNGS
ncbi:hypothetical protein BX616_011023 [Lobosporangium transversale]|uniref:F-box domain-containing protein n=1 Tax=Lobosporangium transversale TaxID=64571 RepID=A0A1Y2H4S7_9FUNG|nr:hypothetical protein BCR41DRAFT_391416 [Lobosporangium transversale]KAF9917884.1 hypothetical protein BX616_011023 [Lobosporangium transversale]ORZ29004.1 hypothetical protein BCR41DRAFT_391416 [Lobosporangium transversale]|eukprot:XP_021886677.1 hypothetical protein BCR41DRAFT_391416 [Lobosporangium transversale]